MTEDGKKLKILIIRLSAIGDTIHTLPMVYELRKSFPNAQIDWVVEQKAKQFVENNPLLDNVFVVEKLCFKNFSKVETVINKIRETVYDIAIDTQQLLKSGVFLHFVKAKRKIMLSGARELSFIFANEIVKAKHNLFDPNYHVIYRNLELVSHLNGVEYKQNYNPVFVLPDTSNEVKDKVDGLLKNIDNSKKTVVLSPFTTWQTKHFNDEFWSNLILKFKDFANIVITGTSNDLEHLDNIFKLVGDKNIENNIINLCGKTNLIELVEVFKRSDIVVSLDSGSSQIAWAVQKPYIISIFTSTSAKRTAPFGEKAKAFYPEISCYPCHQKVCKRHNKNHELCKKSINCDKIMSEIKKQLNLL